MKAVRFLVVLGLCLAAALLFARTSFAKQMQYSAAGGGLQVLVVDDDENSPDVQAYYTDALTNLGITYGVWDTGNSDANEPVLADLLNYDAVIWATGDDFTTTTTGPSAASEGELAAFLDAGLVEQGDGHCLLMASQDYLWAKGGAGADIPTSFMVDYLGLASGTSDVSQATLTGAIPAFGNFTINSLYTNWTDELLPDATANSMHVGDQGNASIYKTTGTYATAYWGFGLEQMDSAADAELLLGRMMNWCYAYTTLGVDLFASE